MKLSYTQTAVLRALAAGGTLKSHRFLDGAKLFKLHGLDGAEQAVRCTTVHALQRRGLITSNQKFPAATFLLTEKGNCSAQMRKSGKPKAIRQDSQDSQDGIRGKIL